MKNLDLYQETYPYVNLWVLQNNEIEIFWDEETKSLVRAYLDEDSYWWKSDAEVQSLDQALEALNDFLENTVFSQAEDFTENWKHSD